MISDSAKKHSPSSFASVNSAKQSRNPTAGVNEHSLESFQIEVAAGKKLRVDGENLAANRGPLDTASLLETETRSASSDSRAWEPSAGFPVIHLKESTQSPLPRKKLPIWGTSFLIHLLVILGLGYFTFSTFEHDLDFTLSLQPEDMAEDELVLQDIEIEPLEFIESDVEQLALEVQEASRLHANELGEEIALADLITTSGSQESGLGELSGLSFGSQGNGLTEMLPAREKLTSRFFGISIEGKRIVFVVDNSGGMRGGELETLVEELMNCVEALTMDQEFYVIFYSDMLYPLFYPDPVQRFVAPSDRVKKRLRLWLDSVEFCLGNEIDSAIKAAAMIRPDTVYLLTDGDLDSTRDQRRLAYLMNTQGRRFAIHTFGLGTGEKGRAAEKLRQVAEANQGTFRAVKVSPAAKEAALQNNRPYHDKAPGEVWGLQVGSGWGRK